MYHCLMCHWYSRAATFCSGEWSSLGLGWTNTRTQPLPPLLRAAKLCGGLDFGMDLPLNQQVTRDTWEYLHQIREVSMPRISWKTWFLPIMSFSETRTRGGKKGNAASQRPPWQTQALQACHFSTHTHKILPFFSNQLILCFTLVYIMYIWMNFSIVVFQSTSWIAELFFII